MKAIHVVRAVAGALLFATAALLGQAPVVRAQISWEWVSGSSSLGFGGYYGIQGQSSVANSPGGRLGSVILYDDLHSDIWVFGGYGRIGSVLGFTNDLWRFSISERKWTWISGNSTGSPIAIAGARGERSATFCPGSRYLASGWIDPVRGKIWIFGGEGPLVSGSTGAGSVLLNDLWQFDMYGAPTWSWLGGNYSAGSQPAVFPPEVNMTDPVALPGGRVGASAFRHADLLYLMFGLGYSNTTGVSGRLSDVWTYNVSSGAWSWISGSFLTDTASQIGPAEQFPSARENALIGFDPDELSVIVYGGFGYYSLSGPVYQLADVWKFHLSSQTWQSIYFPHTEAIVLPIGGPKGIYNESMNPSCRSRGVSGYLPSTKEFWIWGGMGYNSAGSSGVLNDMWFLNMTDMRWKWVSGSLELKAWTKFGTKGVPSSENDPGARSYPKGLGDNQGNFWIYSGANATGLYMSDLWRGSQTEPPPQPCVGDPPVFPPGSGEPVCVDGKWVISGSVVIGDSDNVTVNATTPVVIEVGGCISLNGTIRVLINQTQRASSEERISLVDFDGGYCNQEETKFSSLAVDLVGSGDCTTSPSSATLEYSDRSLALVFRGIDNNGCNSASPTASIGGISETNLIIAIAVPCSAVVLIGAILIGVCCRKRVVASYQMESASKKIEKARLEGREL